MQNTKKIDPKSVEIQVKSRFWPDFFTFPV